MFACVNGRQRERRERGERAKEREKSERERERERHTQGLGFKACCLVVSVVSLMSPTASDTTP